MPFPSNHWLLNLQGVLYTDERFSIGLRMTNGGGFPGGTTVQDACDAYAAAVRTWWSGSTLINTNAKLDLVKFNLIGVDGRYVNTSETYFTEIEPPQGTSTSNNAHPAQVALAVTLETGVLRGLAHRGRIFLPIPAFDLDATGRIPVGSIGIASGASTALLDAINAVFPVNRVVVGSNVGAGAFRPVTNVSVGRVMDTIRSRRTSLNEERVIGAALAPA